MIYIADEQTPFTGTIFSRHENGKPEREVINLDRKRNGEKKEWYENGQLGKEETWRDDKIDGLSKVLYESGKLNKEGKWKNGQVFGIHCSRSSNRRFRTNLRHFEPDYCER
ncbi:hypothetical protein HYY75_09420 [bacterium]|nr:hypothetical protein [bacterium]